MMELISYGANYTASKTLLGGKAPFFVDFNKTPPHQIHFSRNTRNPVSNLRSMSRDAIPFHVVTEDLYYPLL